ITCALTPAYVKRFHFGFYPTTVLEIAILLTVVVFAIETWRQRTQVEWKSPFTLPAILFLVAGVISILVAPQPVKALGLFRAYLVEPIALFVVISTVVTSRRRAMLVLGGLAIAGVVVAVPNAFVVLQAARHHTLNLAGAPPVVIYTTQNAVALFCVPLIAVAASLALYARDRRERLISVAVLLVTGAGTLLSFSRAGYLALAVLALLLAATHPRRWILVPAVLIVGVAVSRIPPVASRLGHEVDFADPNNSLAERYQLWKATLRMLRDHPVFGSGLSGFADTIAPYRQADVFRERLIYPHNIVLNFWTETGLLGLAAFAWILGAGLTVTWRAWRTARVDWRPIELGIFLALVAIIVHGLVDVPYWKNDLSTEFWVLIALGWAGVRWGGREGEA
ncbi:MAG TPA: O-antigen ligase family protein, partial [Candidatus Dormibacteraeota bacterium]|nr:O-antigen ligase family protein [Candidatus Dormibacteraeota bacterium]